MIYIRPGAVLDAHQRGVIKNIEPWTTGLNLEVTRGHESPRGQLKLIGRLAERHRVKFDEFDPNVTDIEATVEVPGYGRIRTWERTWSWLLHIEVIINPPVSGKCLFSYTRPSGEQMEGKMIDPSPHIKEVPTDEEIKSGKFEKCPIDFSSKVNGEANLDLAVKILTRAKDAGAGIRFVKAEPKNGCCHCDLS